MNYAEEINKLLDDCKYGRITNVEGSNLMIPLLMKAIVLSASHKELVGVLKKYGKHHPRCFKERQKALGGEDYHKCTCGFTEALARAEAVQKEIDND